MAPEVIDYITEEDVLAIFYYGSLIYKTTTEFSDIDSVIIVKDHINEQQLETTEGTVNLYKKNTFQKLINEHDIVALECYMKGSSYSSLEFEFELDLSILRKVFSKTASNSWVKAKKKFEVEKESYIAKKSLFHALRILNFGIQIAKFGTIKDFSSANSYWKEIWKNSSENWGDYKKIYQPLYNKLKSEFKLVAPLDN